MKRNQYFWTHVKKFNQLMKRSIDGPDCTDPEICLGDCCSIKIDIPKVLAEEYIKRGYATKNDFQRSNIFSFRLRFDECSGKCFLFDKNINGCSVHKSGIKPPQCWIYPTNFSNPKGHDIECKRSGGWKIVDPKGVQKAQKLLEKYIFLCKLEARRELKDFKLRLGNDYNNFAQKNKEILIKRIQYTAPKHFAGLQDGWDHFDVLIAEGFSLQLKKFCTKECQKQADKMEDYLSCSNICKTIADKIIEVYQQNLEIYIEQFGADVDGHYPFHKIIANDLQG
ncbi:MAG: hypothetical protein BAJALOKI2v1_40034 [Promethearchaeota archaeon]|nr:MAG: hypothetical protein BAJALOKI2v1_40034 [Candidatus Lokiarchaeota archaeon]